jgi:hypothetical protein
VSDDALAVVISMGFSNEEAFHALVRHRNDTNAAIQELVENISKGSTTDGGALGQFQGLSSEIAPSVKQENLVDSKSLQPTSSNTFSDSLEQSSSSEAEEEEYGASQELMDISSDAYEYLNLTLAEETQILEEYRLLCDSFGM